jgi:regulator of replication initiation timing
MSALLSWVMGKLAGKWIYLATVLLCLAVGGMIGYKSCTKFRVRPLEQENIRLAQQVEKMKADLTMVVEANAITNVTIEKLKNERVNLAKGYESRLIEQNELMQEIEKICRLKKVKKGGLDGTIHSSDPMLDELNRLFPADR